MMIKINIKIKKKLWLKVEIEKNNIFSRKSQEKKTAIKTTMTKLKNIVPSIWGER